MSHAGFPQRGLRQRAWRAAAGMVRQVRLGSTLAAAAAFAVLAGCAAQPALDVNLIGLAPVESTLFEQRLRVDFRLHNFSDRVFRARGFQVTLDVNGQRLARGVDDSSFLLTGLSDTTASAVVSTSLFAVARQLLEISQRQTFDYELSGRLYLDGWPRSVPFSRRGEIRREDLERLIGAGGREPAALTF
ncbi:MAG TPA: LEA type 2 family protein [Pseudomonadales bacterium]